MILNHYIMTPRHVATCLIWWHDVVVESHDYHTVHSLLQSIVHRYHLFHLDSAVPKLLKVVEVSCNASTTENNQKWRVFEAVMILEHRVIMRRRVAAMFTGAHC